MSLQRYDSVGWEEMDESPTGEFVRLEDIIKLLEDKNTCDGALSSGNCTCAAIALIKGEK